MFRYIYIYILLFTHFSSTFAHESQPNREFRGVWISTILNIDWPSSNTLTSEQQQKEFISLLEFHKSNGINAVIVQIRPAAESIYHSKYEPWSQWLTGKKGKAPNPYYDPLKFMIDETHKRCMEFHAWLNPYRAVYNVNTDKSKLQIQKENPDWFVKCGTKLLFDPGIPETREYIGKIVEDVVERYDIDGIHFDDYFYPNINTISFDDSYSFRNYNRGYNKYEKEQWRRENVNLLIKHVSEKIKGIKPWVKFGISPFGIWRNKSNDYRGSDTRGSSCYDHMFADVLYWLQNDWIDYLAPQVYWSIGHKYADYEALTKWWSRHSYGKHIYIGHATYKVNKRSNNRSWRDANEIPKQIELNRKLKTIKGSVFFSSKSIKKNPLGIADSLKHSLFSTKALIPVIRNIDSIPPDIPEDIQILELYNCSKLVWNQETIFNDAESKPFYYIVYRFEEKSNIKKTNSKYIYSIQKDNELLLPKNRRKRKYYYRISAVDRLHNESTATEYIKLKL